MKRCRYLINGRCTNDSVACEKCSSTEIEMKSCAPFQRSIILNDDNLGIEVEENKTNTPTLDRMLEIQEDSQLCGEFLNWFLHRYTVFDRRQSRETPFVDVMGNSDYINKEKLLAEFFDIDLDEAEKERELLLKQVANGK